jgi:hypothetical protein
MVRGRLLLPLNAIAAIIAASACGDPASFRPAKGAVEQAPVKEAFRVKHATPDCVSVGYINAEGERVLDDIAATAASHGANTYVIVNEDRDERVTTGDAFGGSLKSRTNRKLIAEAYRCLSTDRDGASR